MFAQEGARAHDGVVGAHDRDEGLRYAADGGQLGEDLGAGAGAVRGAIVVVVELAWQEGAGMSLRELLGQRDAAEEAPSSRLTRRTVAPRLRIRSLRSWLIQSGMKIVTGWPCARPMAAKAMPVLPLGGFRDRRAGGERHPRVRTGEDVQRHAVLDAAGVVQVLGFGVDRARAAAERHATAIIGVSPTRWPRASRRRRVWTWAMGQGVLAGMGGAARRETADYAPPAEPAWRWPREPLRGRGNRCINVQYAADR